MRISHLLGMLVSAMLITGCASMSGSAGTTSSPTAASAANSDAAITQKVKDSLLADPETAGQTFNVDTAQGKVTLKGEVKSVTAYRKAPSIAKSIPGVVAVDNQLVVCLTCK